MSVESTDRSDLLVLAKFLRVSAWLAIRFGLSRSDFRRWALVAWEQEQ